MAMPDFENISYRADREAIRLRLPRGISRRPRAYGVSIDDADTRDVDDVWMLTRQGKDQLLEVSIADPTSVVPRDSAIAQQAYDLAFTRYAGYNTQHMYPRILSEGVLSLLPGQDVPAVTFSLTLGPRLAHGDFKIRRTVVKNSAKLNYEEVDDAIKTGNHPYAKMFRDAGEVSLKLLKMRQDAGAFVLIDRGTGRAVAEDGDVRKIHPRYGSAHFIIQEFMLAINRELADYCAKQGIDILFRNHALKPGESEIPFSTTLFSQDGNVARRDLKKRFMKLFDRAYYSPVPLGHAGLRLPRYTHGTSPLRRHADNITHAQVLAAEEGKPLPHDRKDLKDLADHINHTTSEYLDHAHTHAYKLACVLAPGAELYLPG